MKIKAFALILCIILCFSVLMVGCQKECTGHVDEDKNAKCDVCGADVCLEHKDENSDAVCDVCQTAIPQPCEHADTDANGYCDKCQGAIVVINQTVAPESGERVNMVVNEIPVNVPLGNYTDAYAPNKYRSIDKMTELNKYYGYTFETEVKQGESSAWTEYKYTIKSKVTGEAIFTITENAWVDVTNYNGLVMAVCDNEYEFYSYTGELIFSQDGEPSYEVDFDDNGWSYITLGDKAYVVERETGKVIAKDLDPKTLVKYPTFDKESEKYGYVCEYNYNYYYPTETIYVYDKAKVVECAYSYDIPSYYENVRWFVLENGNVLVQAVVELSEDAASYDYFEDGTKYDIVYDMIDPAAKTVKSVEFGYYIDSISQPDGDGIYNDKALNVASVYSIVNDRKDNNATKIMVVDNDLKVLFELTQVVGKNFTSITPVATDVYQVVYSINNESVKELIDANGKHITYLADSAYVAAGKIVYGGKLYNLDMTPAAEGYDVCYGGSRDYAILEKYNEETFVTEYFYYNGNTIVLVEAYSNAYSFGYIAANTLYGVDGNVIGTVESSYIDNVEEITAGVYGFYCGGDYYVMR